MKANSCNDFFDKIVVFFLRREVLILKLIPLLIFPFFVFPLFAQQMIQPQYSAQMQPNNNNYLRNSTAFRQEIARFEITVNREGKQPLSLSQVPRVQKDDVIKVKLLEEAVNGIKLDQSLYNWTMLVAFINPNRKISNGGTAGVGSKELGVRSGASNSFADNGSKNTVKSDKESSVSAEIQFRKTGWYKEYSFKVPYDSQPIFFLYPRPNYRSKILNLINKNYKEIKALGEKTIEIAGAYGQISLFLNELQGVISGNNYGTNGMGGYGTTGYYGNTIGGYNSSIYNNYNRYNNYPGYNQQFNFNLFIAQAVERMARGFNISLPNNCWQGSQSFANTNTYNNYGGYNSYNSFNLINQQPTISPELVTRLQCVAKNIRLEDFDLSVSKLLQQGGMLLAVQLQQKYPQLSYWINVAALAIDLIVKITKKSPLRIVPAVSSSSDNPNAGSYGVTGSYQSSPSYQNSYNSGNSAASGNSANLRNQPMPKISLFAESQPDDNQFVTAYPIVLHKWQAEPDAEVISLRPPVLMEPCLHAGVNVLKSTDLTDAQITDTFTKDYTLTMTASNGFKKEFPLKKNIGLNGWELNITPQDLQDFPKIQMSLQSVISGTRGFNEIKSPPFYLPISIGGSWQITPESQQNYVVGGKRTISIRNTLGNCQCLQAVIYKPSFGGQFIFAADDKEHGLSYSPDNKEVSFEVDATNFQAGAGEIELRTYGGEAQKLPLKLYPLPPSITNLKINKGDREAIISGDRLEQITSVKINGRRATVVSSQSLQGSQSSPSYSNQPNSATPQLPANSANYVPNLQTNNPNERIIVFEDTNAKITENTATLELGLDDNRIFQVKQTFPVAPSRPTIVANGNREVEGTAIENGKWKAVGVKNGKWKVENESNTPLSTLHSPLSTNLTFPIDTNEISLNVQNALTDYDFKVENLSIETRLEKSSANGNSSNGFTPPYNSYGGDGAMPKASFEVLDWKNLRINFQLSEQMQKLLGGRRLQFRIRDKERGDSDWYSIKQTFVRIPQIASITCTTEMNGMCEMKGASIDYISQVSIDGGQSWYPQSPTTLQVQPTQDGNKLAMIPLLANKKLLMIKLRDFPKGEGVFINGFSFSNTAKVIKQPVSPPNQTQPKSPILNQPGTIQNNQPTQPVPNQPKAGNTVKKTKGKTMP